MEDKGDVSRVENLLRLNISHIKVEHLTFIFGFVRFFIGVSIAGRALR